jgi:hypothetical protein
MRLASIYALKLLVLNQNLLISRVFIYPLRTIDVSVAIVGIIIIQILFSSELKQYLYQNYVIYIAF